MSILTHTWRLTGNGGEIKIDGDIVAEIIQWEAEIKKELFLKDDFTVTGWSTFEPISSFCCWRGIATIKPVEGKQSKLELLQTEPKIVQVRLSKPTADVSLRETEALIFNAKPWRDKLDEIAILGRGNPIEDI